MPRTNRVPIPVIAQRIIDRKERARKYAWGKYFGECNDHHHTLMNMLQTARSLNLLVAQNHSSPGEGVENVPQHLATEIEEMVNELKKQLECPICLDEIATGQLAITGCGHKYCKTCLDHLKTQVSPQCAMCRRAIK